MTKGVHIQVSTMTMAQGARATSPIIEKDDGSAPVRNADRVVEEADLRLVEEGPEVAHHRRATASSAAR